MIKQLVLNIWKTFNIVLYIQWSDSIKILEITRDLIAVSIIRDIRKQER